MLVLEFLRYHEVEDLFTLYGSEAACCLVVITTGDGKRKGIGDHVVVCEGTRVQTNELIGNRCAITSGDRCDSGFLSMRVGYRARAALQVVSRWRVAREK